MLFALCGELWTEKVLFYFSGVCKSAVAHYPAGVITSHRVLQPVKRKGWVTLEYSRITHPLVGLILLSEALRFLLRLVRANLS